jgi:tetratricopeptide (TPR) repeat protein
MDNRPTWARRIRAARVVLGWSQPDAVRAMQALGQLAGSDSLVRQWKRWEAGDVEPGAFYKPLIARALETTVAHLFSPERDVDVLAGTGMNTLDLVARLRASDVSPATLEALAITSNQLSCDYSRQPPAQLRGEGLGWLRRLTGLLDRRLTLAQHQEVLSLAGQVALLVGCLEADMGQRRAAEATRRAALSLGQEAGDAHIVGWAHEMRAWAALTEGQHRAAIAAADAGLAAAPNLGVAVQLAAHKAKALARLGDREQVEMTLGQGQALLDRLPYPTNLDNHFVVDPTKWAFYTLDCYRHIHRDDLAENYAYEVIREGTSVDGTVTRPMRVAEAHVTLGVVAARQGKLEEAIAAGRQALAGGRRSLPSLVMCVGELMVELRTSYPGEPAVDDFAAEVRALTA